jgi:hypothetical protein
MMNKDNTIFVKTKSSKWLDLRKMIYQNQKLQQLR